MRRISLILTVALACLAGVTIASSATAGNFDKFRMGCVEEEPAVCPTGIVGTPYSITIYLDRDSETDFERGADFDCATYRVTSGAFPPGLSISDEGYISGTGTSPGRYAFTVTITDATGAKTSVPWNITILPLLSFVPNIKAPAAGHVGLRYHWTFRTTGASKTRSFVLKGKRPPGLTLDKATGTLAGTPTKKGTYRVTIRVTGDSATVIQKSFTISIR